MMMFIGSPWYGGLWFVYCIRKASVTVTDPTDVIGTWANIEEPSTINARVEPALVFRRGFVCNDCLATTSGWVCDDEHEGIKQQTQRSGHFESRNLRKGRGGNANGGRQAAGGRRRPRSTKRALCAWTAITVVTPNGGNAQNTMTDGRFSLSNDPLTENPNPLADWRDDDFSDGNDTASQRSISLSSPPTSPKQDPDTFPASPESIYSPDTATAKWNQQSATASTPAIESAFVGQSSHMFPPTPPTVRGDTESVASFSTDASIPKKAQRESILLHPLTGPVILGIALVDFNHIVGPRIEFHEGEIFEDEEIAKILPFLALPDGAHLVTNPVPTNPCTLIPNTQPKTPPLSLLRTTRISTSSPHHRTQPQCSEYRKSSLNPPSIGPRLTSQQVQPPNSSISTSCQGCRRHTINGPEGCGRAGFKATVRAH